MKTVVCDLSFGDTGKGRVSAFFCKKLNCAWSVRYNGSNNAGHTVYDDEGTEFKLHQLPAGAVLGKKVCLDVGMAINAEELKRELLSLKHPIDLYISKNVHLIQPRHIEADAQGSGIGSTKKGTAYVYADRALRKGIRVEDKKDELEAELKCKVYSGLPPIGNENALFEAAQGILLDIDYCKSWPFCSSSSHMPSMVHRINHVIAVAKGYTTKVGSGPFYPDVPELRERGSEFGCTTGRPRQCAWFNMNDMDYALSVINPNEVVITKLDILDGMKIGCYDRSEQLVWFDSLNSYENFLLEQYPQIKWFSTSPKGDLIKVR